MWLINIVTDVRRVYYYFIDKYGNEAQFQINIFYIDDVVQKLTYTYSHSQKVNMQSIGNL